MKASLIVLGLLYLGTFTQSTQAKEGDVEGEHTTVETKVTHDPKTKTTIETTVEKNKGRFASPQGVIRTENTLKVKEERSDDGSKSVIKTEETRVEQLEK